MSNDNAFSEAWFKPLKYAPVFPERFTTATTQAILNLPDAAWINPPIQEAQQNKTIQQTAAQLSLDSTTLTNSALPR